MSTDVNSMNCGSFFIKNSKEALEWLHMIMKQKAEYKIHKWPWPEQTPMITTYIKYQKWIKIVPQKEINSYNYAILYSWLDNKDHLGVVGEWAPGDWVVHWPGIPNATRLQLAAAIKPKIIY